MLRKDVREREDTIADKERRMAELKGKNKELEKFKYVLDYKLRELKKELEPRSALCCGCFTLLRFLDTLAARLPCAHTIASRANADRMAPVMLFCSVPCRDEALSRMRTTVTELDDELQRDFKQNVALTQDVQDKQAKIDSLSRELKRERRLLSEKERLISSFARDLHRLVTHTEPALWKDAIKDIYR